MVATKALENDEGELGLGAIQKLMDAIDSEIAEPVRDVDKPLLMSVEDVFTITGRGTVATGRIERGIVKVGDEIEIVGLGEFQRPPAQELKCSARNWAKDKQVTMLESCLEVLRSRHSKGHVIAAPGSIKPHTSSSNLCLEQR